MKLIGLNTTSFMSVIGSSKADSIDHLKIDLLMVNPAHITAIVAHHESKSVTVMMADGERYRVTDTPKEIYQRILEATEP